MDVAAAKTDRLGLRTSTRQRALLEAASDAEGVTVTDFVLRHATRAAENVLADRRIFGVDDAAWEAFTTTLDRPPREIPGLRDLLASATVLDEG
ncbi:DUF1778 domain-containing protein [Frankia sp. Cr2]|uniref:type II toxin-antitoxin system TacA family antitoxin n=1 Tax=Frankia sp. Cr2 TaxID=3073932 RepID=UPI002AD5940E|nr:DUF1778 domain-containing protein [Frankia sp. Cr2]